MMTGYEVGLKLFLKTEIKETSDPEFIPDTAYCGSADLKALADFFNCLIGNFEKLEIFLHVGIFPETGKVRLIPYFDGPIVNLLAVSFDAVCEHSGNHVSPLFVILGRCGISSPVENSLLAACHLFRHETKLKERCDANALVHIKDSVEICVIVLYSPYSVEIEALEYSHVVSEKTMASDV